MKTFDENSTSASMINDRIIELPEGKKGTIVRLVKNAWEEITEVWVTTASGNKRRFRLTPEVEKLISSPGVANGVEINTNTYFYSPAVTGQRIKVKSKKTGKIMAKVQLEDECMILRYGKKVFRKLKTIKNDPDIKEEGGITSRNLTIIKTKMGGKNGVLFMDYDVTASTKTTEMPEISGIEETIEEIESHAEEKVDIVALREMLGLVHSEDPEEQIENDDIEEPDSEDDDLSVDEDDSEDNDNDLDLDDEDDSNEDESDDEDLDLDDDSEDSDSDEDEDLNIDDLDDEDDSDEEEVEEKPKKKAVKTAKQKIQAKASKKKTKPVRKKK